jgi:hypothetical protein
MEKKISDKTIEIDDLINNSNRNLKSNSSIGKLFVRFAFSHIGLIILVIAFIVGGAFLFQLLEQHASIQKCQEGEGKSNNLIKSYRTALFNYIRLNLTEIETLLYKEVNLTSLSNYDLYVQKRIEFINSYHKDAQTFLMNLRDEVLLIEKTYKYRGQNCINETSWTIESSLLYTLTLLSTIGYGHVTVYFYLFYIYLIFIFFKLLFLADNMGRPNSVHLLFDDRNSVVFANYGRYKFGDEQAIQKRIQQSCKNLVLEKRVEKE